MNLQIGSSANDPEIKNSVTGARKIRRRSVKRSRAVAGTEHAVRVSRAFTASSDEWNLMDISEQPALGSIQLEGSKSIDAGAAGHKKCLPGFIARNAPTGS